MCASPQATHLRFLALTALCLWQLSFASDLPAATPSFPCKKAKTWAEKVICDTESLSLQDRQLASDYARLLEKLSGETAPKLTTEQRAWWASRDECRDAADPVTCLWKKYDDRITALRVRPEFPSDISTPRQESTESDAKTEPGARAEPGAKADPSIREGGAGWSKGLSDYIQAIRACLPLMPVATAAVSHASFDEDEIDVIVTMLATNEQTWVCVARRDGLRVTDLHEKGSADKLPAPGPYLYVGRIPPKAPCGAIEVVDANDRSVGWLANRRCE
jgi:uncharacterized protein